MNDEEFPDNLNPKQPSYLAAEIERLRAAAVNTTEKREFIPQPLFWSLFFSELDKVKRERKRIRTIEEALSKLG